MSVQGCQTCNQMKRQGLRAQPAELPSSLGSRGRFDVQATSIQVLDNVSEEEQSLTIIKIIPLRLQRASSPGSVSRHRRIFEPADEGSFGFAEFREQPHP